MIENNGHDSLMSRLGQLSKDELLEVAVAQDVSAEMLSESIAELQFQLEDVGWKRLNWDGHTGKSFTPDEILKIIDLTRAAYIANPLIHHAIEVQADYVCGQGCSVLAKPTEEVNETLQAFWDAHENQKILTNQISLWTREIQLRTDANIFFVLFPNIFTG